jgi:DNA-binding CsgD family transcriptional regulator
MLQFSTPASNTCLPKAFLDLSAYWREVPYAEVPLDYGTLAHIDPTVGIILSHSACLTWILDLRTLQYAFVSGNARKLTGHEAGAFQEGGLAFFNSILHPEDLHVFWKLMKQIWDFLQSLPLWQLRHYRFNCDYRLQKPDGSYVRMLEQNAVLQSDGQGHITHLLGTSSDISSWKKSEGMVASLISDEEKTCIFCTPEQEGLRTPTQLSKREQEIVRLLSEGCSSKMIAGELSISVHTVNTHRQKIIEKTNTRNTGGAVQFAMLL